MKLLATLITYTFLTVAAAQTDLKCSKNGLNIIYVNGQDNELIDVMLVRSKLSSLYGSKYRSKRLDEKNVNFGFVYNRTFGQSTSGVPIADFLESIVLILASRPGVTIEEAWNATYRTLMNLWDPNDELDRWLISKTQAIQLINTPEVLGRLYGATVQDLGMIKEKTKSYLANDKKVIFLSHSQGNLFVNRAYIELAQENTQIKGKPFIENVDVIGNLQIASPASSIAIPKSSLVTNHLDAILRAPTSMGPTFFLALPFPDTRTSTSDQRLNHSMLDTYLGGSVGSTVRGNLPELRDRVFEELERVAISLESNCDEVEFFLSVNPRGTYLYTDRGSDHPWAPDFAAPATRLNLASIPDIDVAPGDIITLQAVGASSWFPDGPDNLNYGLLAVFSGPGGLLFPGPLTTADEIVSQPTMPRGFQTDIAEDRFIPYDSAVELEIPEGATALLFSLNDGYFYDNSDPNGDFGVLVKVTIKKSSQD